MPETVPCPSCRSAVSVPADHAEPRIRCGICWAEVPIANRSVSVPPAPMVPPPAPAIAVARRPAVALPGKAPPGMAKLEDRMLRAAARLVPAPAPVLAKPVLAAAVAKPATPLVEIAPALLTVAPSPSRVVPVPVAAEPAVESPPDEPAERPSRIRKSNRRAPRNDDDDDDDLPRRRSKRPERNPMIPLAIGGVVFLVLLVGGMYLLARSVRGPSDRDPVPVADGDDPALQFNLPNPDPNPQAMPAPPAMGFNPFPKMPNMEPPGANLAMTAFVGNGYTAKVFGKPTERPSIMNLYDDAFLIAHARTKHLRCSSVPPSATIEITTADVPQGVTPDLKKIVAETVFRRGEVKAAKFAGHDGFEHVDDFAGRNTTSRIVQVGCRIFLAKFSIMDAFGDRRTAETTRKEFFDSFKVTFDPKTPAPVDPSLVPKRQFGPPNIPVPPKPKLPGRP